MKATMNNVVGEKLLLWGHHIFLEVEVERDLWGYFEVVGKIENKCGGGEWSKVKGPCVLLKGKIRAFGL